MSTNLNEQQKKIAEHLDGMLVVDAGPGTGKTHTIVERYFNLLKKEVDPMDILMLTFTKNAAQEMKERIIQKMSKSEYDDKTNSVRTSTFDAVCLRIVLNSPDVVSEFFDVKETLSRNAHLIENETLNEDYFRNYYAHFVNKHGGRYISSDTNVAALVSDSVDDVYDIVKKLMSRGVLPLKYEWFGNGEKIVTGDPKKIFNLLNELKKKDKDKFKKEIMRMYNTPEDWCLPDIDPGDQMADDLLDDAANEDRSYLLEFIRDVYYGYIVQSITDNRLTFGLTSLFAFVVLYGDQRSRELNRVDYITVDEFQDTNELHLMIALLLLKKPNICVVGDWKQGIYSFRHATIENIIDFESRVDLFITRLNRDGAERIPFRMCSTTTISLTENYRSSSLILDKAFHALEIKATGGDEVPTIAEDSNIKILDSVKNDMMGEYTDFELIRSKDRDSEVADVVRKILDYKKSKRYRILDDDGSFRDVRYDDIAVLCRTGNMCRDILKATEKENVPAFFQGDLDIMSTREGKLTLAWLRYVNNENDRRGTAAILADLKVPLSNMISMVRKTYRKDSSNATADVDSALPAEIIEQRRNLMRKRKRPNDLLTSIFAFYDLDNDITQSIISTLSSAYGNSLLTISDLIRLIEEDIRKSTEYAVDAALDDDAVTIQTIHKSKGLEYPIVIVAGINNRSMPNMNVNKSILRFDDLGGIRCTKEFFSRTEDGVLHERVLKSWRHELVSMVGKTDYSEERRLLFVALSRAKQYISMSCSNPSKYMEYYGIANAKEIPVFTETESPEIKPLADAPVISEYKKRRMNVSVHDLMDILSGGHIDEDDNSKGADYGTRVHDAAYLMSRGMRYDEGLPETEEIRKILDSVEGAKVQTEIRCVLPCNDVSIRGVIDLIAEFDDRVEIHDYKTDETDNYLRQYTFQVSVYAHSASSSGKPVKCFIDFVSQKKSIEIVPEPIEDINATVEEYLRRLQVQ